MGIEERSGIRLGLARVRGWAGLRSPGGPAGSWATSDGREKPGGLLGWPKERKGVSFPYFRKRKEPRDLFGGSIKPEVN